MSSKSAQLLASGKITKQEFDRRKAQSQNRQLGQPKAVKQKKKQKKQREQRPRKTKLPRTMEVKEKPARMPKGGLSLEGGNSPDRDNSMLAYLGALIDPKNCIARVPDAYARPTAVFRSPLAYDIPVTVDGFTGGRFSVCIQPKLGDISTPNHYQIAITNSQGITDSGTLYKNVNWALPSSYIGQDEEGSDPRIDRNAPFLTSSQIGFWGKSFTIANAPLLSSNYPVPSTGGVLSPSNYLYGPNIYDSSTTPATGASVIRLPFGDWLVSLELKYQVSVLPGSGYLAITTGPTSNPAVIVEKNNPQSTVAATGTTRTAAATFNVISRPGANNLCLVLAQNQNLSQPAYADATVSASYFTMSPAYFQSADPYLDGGIIEEIRPVGLSVLASYESTSFLNGGEIAVANVPGAAIQSNFFQNNVGGLGQLQFVETVRKYDRNYNGPIKDGCYAVWTPFSPEDTDLFPPSEMNDHPYPGIVISGVFAPNVTISTAQVVMRLEINICYEYYTKFTMVQSIKCIGAQELVDRVSLLMSTQVLCRANGVHIEWLKRMAQEGYAFYKRNRSVIDPLLTLAMTAVI